MPRCSWRRYGDEPNNCLKTGLSTRVSGTKNLRRLLSATSCLARADVVAIEVTCCCHESHLRIPRDEVHNYLGELWTLVFLEEMTCSDDRDVRLAVCPGDPILEEAVDWQSAGIRAWRGRATEGRVQVAERGQERLVQTFEYGPG